MPLATIIVLHHQSTKHLPGPAHICMCVPPTRPYFHSIEIQPVIIETRISLQDIRDMYLLHECVTDLVTRPSRRKLEDFRTLCQTQSLS
jgi:hypothetical protein